MDTVPDSLIETFHKDGFLLLRGVLGSERCAALIEDQHAVLSIARNLQAVAFGRVRGAEDPTDAVLALTDRRHDGQHLGVEVADLRPGDPPGGDGAGLKHGNPELPVCDLDLGVLAGVLGPVVGIIEGILPVRFAQPEGRVAGIAVWRFRGRQCHRRNWRHGRKIRPGGGGELQGRSDGRGQGLGGQHRRLLGGSRQGGYHAWIRGGLRVWQILNPLGLDRLGDQGLQQDIFI